MKNQIKLFVATLLLVVVTACNNNNSNNSNNSSQELLVKREAKYIFYFIGDGMAAPQVQLAEAALTSSKFRANYKRQTGSELKEQLNLKGFNITGLATSNAKNRYITDSAAAGTALATGDKTDVGVISLTPEGDTLRTMAEMAKAKGLKVGIVSSVSIDHATPASFYAHVMSRSQYANISDQLLLSEFDYFAGGSVKWDKRAQRDSVDKATAYAEYLEVAADKGYRFVTTKAEFDELSGGTNDKIIATLDMLANEQNTSDGSAMPYTIDLMRESKADNRLSLADFTRKGVEIMEGDEGFFMMVEGGKIDWACHANDAATVAYEVVAFDEAIGVALEFAARHPKETLIIVTGDHDCGGLAMGFAGTGYESAFELLGASQISYFEFTKGVRQRLAKKATFEELLAYACQEFGFTNEITDGSDGIITNTAELSNHEVELLREAYRKSAKLSSLDEADKYRSSFGGYDPFTTICTHILNHKSGVSFTSFTHTALPVMVFAQGANEGLFSGYYDNTDIARRIIIAAGL